MYRKLGKPYNNDKIKRTLKTKYCDLLNDRSPVYGDHGTIDTHLDRQVGENGQPAIKTPFKYYLLMAVRPNEYSRHYGGWD